jgi:hypothetical protein
VAEEAYQAAQKVARMEASVAMMAMAPGGAWEHDDRHGGRGGDEGGGQHGGDSGGEGCTSR